MATIPSVEPNPIPFWQRKSVTDGLVAVPTVASLFGAGIVANANPSVPNWLPTGIIGMGILATLGVYTKARLGHEEDKKRALPSTPEWLLSALHTLHAELCAEMNVCYPGSDGALRITLHRTDWARPEQEQLEQVVDYLGPRQAKGRGRRFPLRAGVVGACAKDAKVVVAHRKGEDVESFRREMVDKWHFTKEEARRLSEDRWSYLAHPILQVTDDRAGAILYVDSSAREAFKKKAPKACAENWCRGFAEFLRTAAGG